ncbi:hypothetical protein EYF80_044430 [Liparis tanakae]|uniref:Secreted protein n=1 Tax=Liparis tanakae TaxID=230148 RepID=A0A4Z2FWT9_9TELE|nr:hypothetical protein EYF80_044430 [Liparis tanakae]
MTVMMMMFLFVVSTRTARGASAQQHAEQVLPHAADVFRSEETFCTLRTAKPDKDNVEDERRCSRLRCQMNHLQITGAHGKTRRQGTMSTDWLAAPQAPNS